MWTNNSVENIYSGLQKGLHVAEGVAGGIATAKGIYEAGRTIYSVGRAVAPALALL